MEERVDVEELRAWANVEVGAVGGQVGFGLVRPKGIKTLAEDIVANGLPIPCAGLGIRGVDVGSRTVIRQSVDRRAVSEMNQPAFLTQLGVVAVIGHKPRPDADHGLKAHFVELLVHGRWVGPELGVQIHLPHLGVVEPVHHDHVGRQMAVAIALSNVQHLLLAGVALLALNVAVGGLGQQRRGAGEQAVARVDLIRRGPGNHEKRNPVAHLRGPGGALVEARLDGGLRRVVPQQPVALVGHQERHAEAGRSRSPVICPATNRMAAMIKKSLVILAQAVVVLVIR